MDSSLPPLGPGTLYLVWQLLAAASGPDAFEIFQRFAGSWLGLLVLFGWSAALFYHLTNGIRHLVWDLGYGFKASERETMTWGALIGGISLTVLVWIVAYAIGGGR